MVGVPGRSKGCSTCKKRRVKCDEGDPPCMRCQKAGYGCTGYFRALEFRHATPKSVATRVSRKSHSHAKNGQRRSSIRDCAAIETSPFPDSVLSTEIGLAAFKDDMRVAFVLENIVYSSYASPWLQLSAQRKHGELAFQACQALCQSVFGKCYNLHDEEVRGSARYGNTLHELQEALATRSTSRLPELFIPILVLLMYSSSHCSLEESEVHIEGLVTLLSACGPEAFREEQLRAAFVSCRAGFVTLALARKKRLFLEDERWRRIPWSMCLEGKSPLERLIDILVVLPGLFEEAHQLSSALVADTEPSLLQRITHQLELLRKWRSEWESKLPNAMWEEQRQSDVVPGYHPVYPPEAHQLLRFTAPDRAVEVSMYNALILSFQGLLGSMLTEQELEAYIRRITVRAKGEANDCRGNATMLDTDEALLHPTKAAIQIARTFDYHLLYARRFKVAAVYWLYPLGLARRKLGGSTTWDTWILEMFAACRAVCGYWSGPMNGGFGSFILEQCETGLI